ncbi:MAG: DUF87 domain-containing protein [Bacteroidota bacterium]
MAARYERQVTYIGETTWRSEHKRFGIRLADRRSHTYIIGKTGTGKSTLLKTLILQDFENRHGLALLDPHGDLTAELKTLLPAHRALDLIDFDVPGNWKELSFNPLVGVDQENRALATSNLLEVFKKIWGAFWGPRLEHVLRNSLITLLYQPKANLGDVLRLLVDNTYRKNAVSRVPFDRVRSFWKTEFEAFPSRMKAEVIAPIQNKVGAFLTNPILEHILTQDTSMFDLREVMDSGKILLVNLSKGRLGEDVSHLLGALIVSMINSTAMGRADIQEDKRKDFFLFADEFQNFTTSALAGMLSELRKYRVGLILAHQFISQLDRDIRDAIFGNVGTMICFRVGAVDAPLLEKEFLPIIQRHDLMNLKNYHVYVRLMIGGEVSIPFSAKTIRMS